MTCLGQDLGSCEVLLRLPALQPVEVGMSPVPSWGVPRGPLHGGATLLRACMAGGTPRWSSSLGRGGGEAPGSNLVGEIKQKVYPGFPCSIFFFKQVASLSENY